MESRVKIILSILLLTCLANMPYGYFMIVRFAALIGFGYLAYVSVNFKSKTIFWVYLSLAILFQPLIKIPLGRELWNVLDVLAAILLLLTLLFPKLGKK